MSSIFLSHNSKDKVFVRKLKERLKNDGVRVWFDEDEMLVGDSLIKKISEGIESMDYLGVVISSSSNNSSWVQKELAIAMRDEINGRRVKVLPILMEECDIPVFLKDKIYANFTEDFENGYKELTRVLFKTKNNIRNSQNLCQAKTSRGKACKKKVAEGSLYCYLPSHQEGYSKEKLEISNKKVSLKSKLTTLVKDPIFLTVISLLFAYVFFIFGPSQRDINEIKQKLDNISQTNKVTFDEEYPYGFKLLAISKNRVISTNNDIIQGFFVDLNNSKVKLVNENSIEIVVPRISYHDSKINQDFRNTRFIIPVTVPRTKRLAKIGEYQLMIKIWGEFDESIVYILYAEKTNDHFQGIKF
ncbi:MAG: toll/interleukin-1 receptor domain-containing protein [Candidatus Omnitrophica bacterium]|nr:toll/interleukin-1 receptor domain-containing protein [Candidatus Omnitrophota bacterium]